MFKFPKNLEIDEIYKKFNINPVSYGNKLSKSNYFKIKSQRKILFYDHLKIPLSFIKNKNILEFGPASGEKSLVYAYYGAKLHLVDSNINFLRLLKSNFKDYKFLKFISKIENRHIENFSSKKKYVLVVAENFLSSTKNRNKNLRTVLDQCNKNGFVLISNSDEYGYFFDFLKSFILKLYFHKNNITDLEKMVNVSKLFFLEDFKNSKNTRNFEKFALDQLILNPGLKQIIWPMKEIIKIVSKKNFRFYSSWPNYANFNKWHKDSIDSKIFNQIVLDAYQKNINQYIFLNKTKQNDIIKKIKISDIKKLMIIMDKNLNKFNNMRELNNFVKSKRNTLFNSISKIFKNTTPLIYKRQKILRQWGSPNHYLVFSKKND